MTGARAPVMPAALGLLGHPIGHSLSPRFQQAALDRCAIPLRYVAIDTPPDALRDRLTALCRTGWAGNITVPHKEAVAALCAECTPAAERVGAVNTVWTDGTGRLIGHNTDLDGLRASLDALVGRAPVAHAVILGAGGAAAAACVAVAERLPGALHVVARSATRAARLLDRLGLAGQSIAWSSAESRRLLSAATLVINASPVGQGTDAFPVPLDHLAREARLLDLVYRSEGTAWVRAARAAGFVAEDGLRMLVEQGAAAFHCWFGVEPPREVMWRALGVSAPPADATRPLP